MAPHRRHLRLTVLLLATMAARRTLAHCELLAISPGAASSVDELKVACSALAEAGCRRLLLREPGLSSVQVKQLVEALLPLYPPDGLILHEKCAGARAIAMEHGLGLHLKSTSNWGAERSHWSGALGASAHSIEELQQAAELGLNWAFFSPVARPTSKPGDLRPPIGEAAVVEAQEMFPSLTVYALGGISVDSAVRLAAGGARGVAVLGGIFSAGSSTSPSEAATAVRQYLQALDTDLGTLVDASLCND